METKEIEIRGKILTLSINIEDSLNRILYNFFIPRNEDTNTRNIFLQNFILPLTFGQKVSLYKQVLNTTRYQEIVSLKLKTNDNSSAKDISGFTKIIQQNLAEIIATRNYVAHGIDISNAFLTLSDDEVVFMKKADFMKFSNKSVEQFSKLVDDTLQLLSVTSGLLTDDIKVWK